MYTETTKDIEITVEPQYVDQHSQPHVGYYFFSYTVKIKNVGDKPAKLLSRTWIITDGEGKVEKVQGPGVVGEQPNIEPGQEYQYTSACPLPTPTGNMRGTYLMTTEDGDKFEATIPLFFLRAASTLH